MHYQIYLNDRKTGESYLYEESLLDLIPKEIVDLIVDRFVEEELGLCENCQDMSYHCHVLRYRADLSKQERCEVYDKLCPILFVDMFNPPWTLEDIA